MPSEVIVYSILARPVEATSSNPVPIPKDRLNSFEPLAINSLEQEYFRCTKERDSFMLYVIAIIIFKEISSREDK
ncbi:MAG TPA: hypothetical protein VN316_00570 [candidate division Zixibacteria bacterium]|nr:hypothetical protein [candidate division Zixibacteria bacterium]